MKRDFKTYNNQCTYINKLIARKTDLKKECVVCKKPATIQHNKINPYAIRFLCKECRAKLEVKVKTVDECNLDLPIINVLDHFNSPFTKYEYKSITLEQINIINEAIKNNWTKKETAEKLKLSYPVLKILIKNYSKINPEIEDMFNKATKQGHRNAILKQALNRVNSDKFNIKILELKRAKQMSTNDIVKKTNNQISANTINLIIEGKLKASDRHKKLIAKALGKKVEEIF